MERADGAKSLSWKVLDGFWHRAISTKNVGILHRQKNMGQSRDAEKGRQEGNKAIGKKESPFKGEQELVKRGSDLSFDPLLTYYEGRSSNWKTSRKNFRKMAASVHGQA